MGLIYDDINEIKDSKRDNCLSKLMRKATKNDNNNGVVILKNAGLSNYVDDFAANLSPFLYNEQWENKNAVYAPEAVFSCLYQEIGQDDKEHQFLFLKAIVEKITRFDYDELIIFNRYLATLGFEIVETDSFDTDGYTLRNISVSVMIEENDYSLFEELCYKTTENAFSYYEEAISTFRNGDYGSAISNCRKLLEAITTSLSGITNTAKAIFQLSGEQFENGIEKVQDCNQATNYWSKKHDKVFRFMRMYTLYNILSGFGSHNDVIPTYNDAFWLIHETQSTLYWLLNK